MIYEHLTTEYADVVRYTTATGATGIVHVPDLATVELVQIVAVRTLLGFRAIDRRTQEGISAGFSHGEEVFSLSGNAQRNWTGILGRGAFKALLKVATTTEENAPTTFEGFRDSLLDALDESFPMAISTQEGKEVSIFSAEEYSEFFDSGFSAVDYWYDSGRQLRTAIVAAVTGLPDLYTLADIDAAFASVVDSR